jgi:hypothetical protein
VGIHITGKGTDEINVGRHYSSKSAEVLNYN